MSVKRVIIDTDIGDDIDDAYALVFALNSPEIDVEAVISNNRYERVRAKIARKLAEKTGKEVPVFEGLKGGIGKLSQGEFVENYSWNPPKLRDNLDFFRNVFKGEIYYVSLGSLTNLSFLLKRIPGAEKNINSHIMGGTVNRNYEGQEEKIAEWNVKSDVEASKEVFSSEMDINMIGLDCTWDLELKEEGISKIRESRSSTCKALHDLYDYWRKDHPERNPILFDVLATESVIDKSLVDYEKKHVYVDKEGKTIESNKGKEVLVGMESDKEAALKLFMERMIS